MELPCRTNTRYFLPPLLCGNLSNTVSASEDSGRNLRGVVEAVGEAISTAFPIWVALGCFMGLVRPDSYNWVQPKWTMMGITFTTLGMGMTLTFDDLKRALAMSKGLLTGFCMQYSLSYAVVLNFMLFDLLSILLILAAGRTDYWNGQGHDGHPSGLPQAYGGGRGRCRGRGSYNSGNGRSKDGEEWWGGGSKISSVQAQAGGSSGGWVSGW